ncbi:MAG: prolipoprotein diacylglyceryl transferase [Clostridia bacterium]|nr:prolipoprotein diacylglyceryl transferase [Clostridia bacterium]
MNTTHTLSFPGLGIDDFEVNEVAFKIFNTPIYYYAIIIAIGMTLAVGYAFWRFYENKIKIDTVIDYAIWILPMSIVGARLYYVIFDMIDRPQNYFNVTHINGEEVNTFVGFLYSIVSVWEGGLAIYGGVIAGGITILIVSKIKKMNTFKILDIAVPSVLFAQTLGRWGNFFNAEAYGEATTLPWRMCSPEFPSRLFENFTSEQIVNKEVGVHPTFLYESLWNLIGVALMIGTLIVATKIIKVSKKKHIDGFFFAFYMMWYGFGRMLIEGLRTDSLWLIPGVIRVSIFVAVITLLAGILLMTFLVARRVVLIKKNIDIWESFKNRFKKSKEVKNGTDN